jgi:adenosylcobyric acid synthase
VIEGAGSPAEINLAPQDYVNLGAARWAREAGSTAALIVADIDRGGAFAHLYGTWSLLPADLKPLVAGFVLNKFRGDAALLAPGPQQLQALTGAPVLGTLPMWHDHGLPEEDGWHGATHPDRSLSAPGPRVAIVAWPHLSNLDEFQPLGACTRLTWARTAADLDGADWIVLPGSKQTSGSLAWLRAQGMDAAIQAHAAAGGPVLGICGGLQALGESLADPEGVDGQAHGPLPGLGLLPLHTHYAAPKRLRATHVRFTAAMATPWQALATQAAPAYEIRCGRTDAAPGLAVALRDARGEAIGWQRGAVLGLYAHGLFEAPAVLEALFGARLPSLDQHLDTLAERLEHHLGAATLHRLCNPNSSCRNP